MKVSTPASHFPRRVNLHTRRTSHNPYQDSFWKHGPAANTRALRYVLPFSSFLGHSTFFLD
jgi:hypothetical protein